MPVWGALIVTALIVVLCAQLWWSYMRRRSRPPVPTPFPPEYERAWHGQRVREAEQEPRRERVRFVQVRALPPPDRERFIEAWRASQARFLEDPPGATLEAGRLVADIMEARGYPARDLDRGAADVAADDPNVIQHYRAAHEIVTRYERGEASSEDLRKAMVFYRLLFEELIGYQEARS